MSPPNFPPQALYAFPWTVTIPDGTGGTHYSTCPGMTLRDYFAAAAIPDAMRAVAAQQVVALLGEEPQHTVARVAYEVADAMLARRNASKTE